MVLRRREWASFLRRRGRVRSAAARAREQAETKNSKKKRNIAGREAREQEINQERQRKKSRLWGRRAARGPPRRLRRRGRVCDPPRRGRMNKKEINQERQRKKRTRKKTTKNSGCAYKKAKKWKRIEEAS